MTKFLTLFDTQADYDAAESTLDLPNVSLVAESNTLFYKPYVHEYVEIGGIKWATMNVGAMDVTDYGLLYQWGDTEGYTADQVGSGTSKKYFGWADYKYGNGTSSPGATGMTKYNSTDGKKVLEASDDAGQVNWGGGWRMPTTAEVQALGTATTSAWTSSYEGSGIAGLVLTDKTDSTKKLFFPAGGYAKNGIAVDVNVVGLCWSSSLYSNGIQSAYYLYFNHSEVHWNSVYGDGGRSVGRSLRLVCD